MSTRTAPPPPPDEFEPVPVRPRADGWTPERQTGFIAALARTANVEAACRAVGMGTSSAYELRARADAHAFREAWQIALDYAVHRLGEAALDRALNGTATPVFFQGQQIGERRRYDEKLTMFILRLRDPERYGRWREERVPMCGPDGGSLLLDAALTRVENEAWAQEAGVAMPRLKPLPALSMLTPRQEEELVALRNGMAEQRAADERERRHRRDLEAWAEGEPDTERGV